MLTETNALEAATAPLATTVSVRAAAVEASTKALAKGVASGAVVAFVLTGAEAASVSTGDATGPHTALTADRCDTVEAFFALGHLTRVALFPAAFATTYTLLAAVARGALCISSAEDAACTIVGNTLLGRAWVQELTREVFGAEITSTTGLVALLVVAWAIAEMLGAVTVVD